MAYYDQYPMMGPYIDSHFGQGGTPALLLVGESHYLPEGSTQYLTADAWYAGDSCTLDKREIGWINIETVFKKARNAAFSNPAHRIWRNALREI